MEDEDLKEIIENAQIEKKGFFDTLRNREINNKKKEIQEELKNLELAKLDYFKSKVEESIKFYEKTAKQNRIGIIKNTSQEDEE